MPAPELNVQQIRHPDGRTVWLYGRPGGTWSPAARRADPEAGHPAVHRRLDRATSQWVAVSPSRNQRPDAGAQQEDGAPDPAPCPLCPGGPELPSSFDAAVFQNRFPTFAADALEPKLADTARSDGSCEVIVYTDAHDAALAVLPPAQMARVVAIWRHRSVAHWTALGDAPGYVMAFENHGVEVGATLSHPHGQLYALPFVPPRVALKADVAQRHRAESGACLACAVVDDDLTGERLVAATRGWVAAVPFAARWPYEVHLRARRHGVGRLADLDADEERELAELLLLTTRAHRELFSRDSAYLLMVQEAPPGSPDWHLHVEVAPPQRSPTSLKMRASVETALDLFINDAVPEESAAALRAAATRSS